MLPLKLEGATDGGVDTSAALPASVAAHTGARIGSKS